MGSSFIRMKNLLSLQNFKTIVETIDKDIQGTETALFKHRKSLTDLSYILFSFYKDGVLRVYATEQNPTEPVGLLMAYASDLWWIECRVLLEGFVIALDRKALGFGRFCVDEMERMAVEQNCKLILSGSSMVEKTAMVANTYYKKGFIPYGVSVLKEVQET